MKFKRKYLLVGLSVYILLLIFNSNYIFNGAFEWVEIINPFENFYAFSVLLGIIIFLLAKRFGGRSEKLDSLQQASNSNQVVCNNKIGFREYFCTLIGILLIWGSVIIGQVDAIAVVSMFIIPLISIALFIPMLRKRKKIGIALMVMIWPMMYLFLLLTCSFTQMTDCPY